MSKITLTIDGKTVEVDEGTLVIQAVRTAGFEIPHYCYHPALGNPGVCRLCMVEVEGMPKLQVSCRLPAKQGMVVRSNSTAARTAQSSSLEFHLANHPLDCPICDQAGECYLQDYYMRYGLYTSSVREDKKHKHKRIDIGNHIMLDSERCILCTRCTRFLDNITKTHELGIFNRGGNSELLPYPGMRVDNAYSGNIADICPVGALTDKDFRFKVRVWYLDKTPSVCTGCARGCSIELHSNTRRPWHNEGKRIARLQPRVNPEVNGWWICDEGRYGFKNIDDKTRLTAVSVLEPASYSLHPSLSREGERMKMKGGENNKDISPLGGEEGVKGSLHRLSWEEASTKIWNELQTLCAEKGSKGLAVVLSGTLSNEDFCAAKALFVDTLKAGYILVKPGPDQLGEEDAILRRKEKVPNGRGAQALGFGGKIAESSWDSIRDGVSSGKIWGLYVVDRDPVSVWGEKDRELLARLLFSAYQGANANHFTEAARWALPACSYAEEEASFINFQGHVQRTWTVLPPLGDSRPDWAIFRDLLLAGENDFPESSAQAIFDRICRTEPEFKGLSWEGLGEHGMKLKGSAEPAGPAKRSKEPVSP